MQDMMITRMNEVAVKASAATDLGKLLSLQSSDPKASHADGLTSQAIDWHPGALTVYSDRFKDHCFRGCIQILIVTDSLCWISFLQ